MLSGLSDYLFGSSSNQAGDAMVTDDTQPQRDTPVKDPVKEIEMDGDWVLVDVTSKYLSWCGATISWGGGSHWIKCDEVLYYMVMFFC